MVDDDNATDESGNNKSGDEGAVQMAGGHMRRPVDDNEDGKNDLEFGRRKSSQNSHFSKGSGPNAKKTNMKSSAMVNNFLPPSQFNNPVVSSVIKQQGWDKMRNLNNLKSVLDSRKNPKGTSGTRPAAKPRKNSGEPSQMNYLKQKASRKSSQDVAGKRPPSQSSKNSGKDGAKPRPPMQNLAKQRVNPMITLTGGGAKATRKQGLLKKQ